MTQEQVGENDRIAAIAGEHGRWARLLQAATFGERLADDYANLLIEGNAPREVLVPTTAPRLNRRQRRERARRANR